MEKPHSFAGRVIKKYGKQTTNDYPQPEKFFNDMADFYTILDGVPFSAVEDLSKYEVNRDIMIKSIQKLLRICWAAKIDILKEVDRVEEDPFEGLEADLAVKKNKSFITISGKTEENS